MLGVSPNTIFMLAFKKIFSIVSAQAHLKQALQSHHNLENFPLQVVCIVTLSQALALPLHNVKILSDNSRLFRCIPSLYISTFLFNTHGNTPRFCYAYQLAFTKPIGVRFSICFDNRKIISHQNLLKFKN